MSPATRTRPPAVAGTFYPDDPGTLARMVDRLLAEAPVRWVPPEGGAPWPKGLIVPHAGYVYSGAPAAAAWKLLGPGRGRIRRVVIAGPAHHVPLAGMAVPTVDELATPLGPLPVDAEARRVALGVPGVVADDLPHAPEHSLEVQYPFLLAVLGPVPVLPVVVGHAGTEAVAALFDALWDGPETVLVVSTDLSHYHDIATARRLDRLTAQRILRLEAGTIGPADACGAFPLNGFLAAARRRGCTVTELALTTSGDTAGPPDRVVGYGAFALTEPGPLTGEDRTRLLDIARHTVAEGVRTGRRPPPPSAAGVSPRLRAPGASFVTLERDGRLLGCIGTLEAHRPLAVDVAANAYAAAFEDPRLPPVTAADLPHMDVKISVLGPLEPVPAATPGELLEAVEPHRHGLVIAAGAHRGTFLPAVWKQIPDPGAFLAHLLAKAGLPPDRWPRDARAWRYEVTELTSPAPAA